LSQIAWKKKSCTAAKIRHSSIVEACLAKEAHLAHAACAQKAIFE